ncbi:integumentary mucin A.1-like isoform X2 [Pecten maximus]|uniref:integumentary mucin A.1-like isoform X2 n=1 Tax=Pecten maximus TaxID=6579 RepID=UPI001458B009|nr:integumentary mucin A.1-like isoform X2 [Pecten maximus]
MPTTSPTTAPPTTATTKPTASPTTAPPNTATTTPTTMPTTSPTTAPPTTATTTPTTMPTTSPTTAPPTTATTTPTAPPTTAPPTTATTTPTTMPTTSPTTTTTPNLPEPPREVSVTSQTSESVTLTVALPTDCDDCGSVIVKYSPTGDTTRKSSTCHPQSCTIESLSAGTCYTFSVYTQGSGVNSTAGTNTTGCTLPSRPTSLAVTNRTMASVTLTVTPGDGGLDGYRVSYNGGGIYDNRNFTDTSSDTPTLLISSLTPGTTFTFNVFTLANGLESEDNYGTQASTSECFEIYYK